MASQDQQSGDIHATLAVSQDEARFGSSRVINFPDGRTMTVVVPAGTYDGQELRLAGQGSASSAGGSLSGDLILRMRVVTSENSADSDDLATERAFYISPDGSMPASATRVESNPGWSDLSTQEPSFTSVPTNVASGNFPLQTPAGNLPSYPEPGGYPIPTGQESFPHYQPYPMPPVGQAMPPNSQPYPNYGGYPAPPNMQSYSQPPASSSGPKRSRGLIALLLIIAVVLIAASGLGFYFGYYQPGQQHAFATQTAQAQTSVATSAAATGSAQVAQATAQAAATGTAGVQATAQAYQNIYTQATRGTPTLDDPLNAPLLASLWDITLGSHADGACAFTGGAYHSTIPNAGFFEPCYALNSNFSNFAFQVNMTITQGDAGGILLRADTAHNKFYLFKINVDDGSFTLYRYTNAKGTQAALLLNGSSPLIKGLNQNNEITVVAQQSTMYFYINRQYLGSVTDNAYHAGEIGVFSESEQKPTEAVFSHAKVWTL